MIGDADARARALSVDQSFIVQAPAGSGKTGLLVYRILRLLASVDKPEQVLAITFTRKATSEMRQRLLELLQAAERQNLDPQNSPKLDDFEQMGVDLAKRVLSQSERRDWQLLDAPGQLQILTIDAFSAKLTGDMPWLSRLGDRPRTTDQAEPLYTAAIEQLFQELLSDQPSKLSLALQTVMLELDFDYNKARRVFSTMLSKRDHWLRHLLENDIANLRPALEAAWQEVGDTLLIQLEEQFVSATLDELTCIATKAADLIEDKGTTLNAFAAYVPGTRLTVEHWRALQFLLFTQKLEAYRKTVNVKCGFPTDQKAHKKQMTELLATLADDVDLLTLFQQLPNIPKPLFSNADWHQLLALETVLKALAGFLQLRFRAVGQCDHSEVTQRASLALQELDSPTDLALRIDYQLQHILVDEFQDTSRSQLELLKRLTAGWQKAGIGGGQTLFLVGDPMQSIYRFREADVGLFLQVANNLETHIFPNIEIQALQLSENFRSSRTLVEWFNGTFQTSFPARNQVLSGAIRYAAASSNKPGSGSIECHLGISKKHEASLIVDAVRQAIAQLPEGQAQVALLVRSRTHLKHLLPAIRAAQIAYSGVDIQPLKETPAVIDVVSLCRAICRLDDRVAWLSLLRGPWCGLTLTEIKQLTSNQQEPVWDQVSSSVTATLLIKSSELRLKRFVGVMQQAIDQRQQIPLHSVVRWTWQDLGGAATLFVAQLQDIEVVFDLIENCQRDGDIPSFAEFDRALDKLYARPVPTEAARLVISTIHKAKGLQYHTVILPSLNSQSKSGEKEVLMWAEHTNNTGESQLLLAPIRLQDDEGTHFDYLRSLEKRRGHNELIRLMYVACTRAEQKVVLIGRAAIDAKTEKPKSPVSSSLLATVWDTLQDDFNLHVQAEPELTAEQTAELDMVLPQTIFRLPKKFKVSYPPSIAWQAQQTTLTSPPEESLIDEKDDQLQYDWATEVATAVGIILHQWLQYNASSLVSLKVDEQQMNQWRIELKQLRVPQQRIKWGVERLVAAIKIMQEDENASFIFQPHKEQANEYALSALEDGKVNTYRLDRTFVDEENTRWVVDYKTTYTQTEDVEQFIQQQIAERHWVQLQRYGRLMRQLDSRPIKLAVYFPLLGKMHSWDYDETDT